MVDQTIVNTIQKYLGELANQGLNISRVFLYGSYAKGNATPDSDIDLLLVSPNYNSLDNFSSGKAWVATKVSNYRIEPILINEKDFLNKKDSMLLEIIRQEGIEIKIN